MSYVEQVQKDYGISPDPAFTPPEPDQIDFGGSAPAQQQAPPNAPLMPPPSISKLAPLKLDGAPPKVDRFDAALAKAPQFKERQGRTIYQNAADDLSQMIQGTTALTNAGVARAIQSAPKEWNPVIPGQGRAPFGQITGVAEQIGGQLDALPGPKERIEQAPQIFGKAAKSAVEDPDLKALSGLVGGIGQYYYDRYLAPFGGGLGAGGAALEEQFLKHPIGTPLDLGLGGSIKTGAGAGRMLAGNAIKEAPMLLNQLPAKARIPLRRLGMNAKMATKGVRGKANTIANHPAGLSDPITQMLIHHPLGLKSKWLIATQPLQAPWQLLQNATIFALTQLNSPRDLLFAATGMLLATSKMRKWIPAEFFGGQAAQLAVKLPRWLSVLSAPDKLMNAHLGLIEKGDNYWRAAAALTMAVRETANVANKRQFYALTDSLGLAFWAQKNIKKLFSDEAAASAYLREVHRTMGNYSKELTGLEARVAKNVMFYKALRHMMILSASFPFENQYKTAAIHALSQVAVKMAESEPMTKKLKEAGAVLYRDEKGRPIMGPNNSGPLVYTKGGSLTPLLMTPQDLLFVMKAANGEGLGDIDGGAQPFAPFWEIMANVFWRSKLGGADFRDPNSIRDPSGRSIKKWKMDAADMGTREIEESDYQSKVAPPIPAILGNAMAPTAWRGVAQFYEHMQKIPGVPSEFTVPFVESAAQRTGTGEKVKPMPMHAGQFFFGKLQPTEPRLDVDTEEKIKTIQGRKMNRSYRYRTRDWED